MDLWDAFFNNCRDAVVIANSDGQVAYANSAAAALFENDYASLLDHTKPSSKILLQASPDDAPWAHHHGIHGIKAYSPLRNAIAGESFCDCECLLRSSPPGSDVWLTITGYPLVLPIASFQGGLLIIRNISAKRTCEAHGLRDTLTGLVNRAAFLDRTEHALDRTRRNEEMLVAILCVDIRRLKAINDTLGHAAGDRLLVAFANRLLELLRPEDTPSRLSGDEFTILIEDVESAVHVAETAEKICQAVSQPFTIEGCDITIEVSIGISFGNGKHQDPALLLKQADIAMHQAKMAFGKHYCVFEDSMNAAVENSLYLEIAIRKAIERNEFFLEYQPIVRVRDQHVIGFESLVRWHHPEQGRLPPGQFIPIAEKTDLIISLGWWVLTESCRQLKVWQDKIPQDDPLFVSVNMSSKQFTQRDLPARIKTVLNETGVHPQCLKLEITESALIENSDYIVDILSEIRAMGIKLSIDDFGIGYSSLSYLHRFPFDTLKLDRSFLVNADSDFEKLEILQSVVRLAWNLGLEVVAEGIETQQHLARIRALRCESGQGFLFSKPLSVDSAEALIQQQSIEI